MPQLFKYPTSTLFLGDYIIGTDSSNSQENVTRNFKVSEVVSAMLHALSIGTVTSISTASSSYITATTVPNPIIATGSITLGLNATGLAADLPTKKLQYLRGDNTWALPGPTPTDVDVSSFGIPLTTDMTSINFTGNVSASGGATGFITVNFPGATALIDSIIAGAGITFTNNAGAATITNAGVVQVRAGGNITLSGGTGDVTISTIANAGTVTIVNPGTGIATITNNSSNPELDVEYIGTNNYIGGNLDATVINQDDFINYHQTPSSSVKRTQLRDIPASILTALTTYIDADDLNKIKNIEPAGFDETAKAKYMVTCTLNDYNAIATKDVNTLYFIVGAGISYTQNLTTDVSGITGSSNYSITTLANGVSGTSVSGPAGTAFSFQVSISGTNGATISNSNMPLTISGSIAINGGTSNAVLTATVTNAASNSVRAKLNNIIYTAGADNLGTAGALGTIWEYEPAPSGSGFNVIGDFSPTSGYITSMPYDYSFTPRVRLIKPDTYKWSPGTAEFTNDPTGRYLKFGYFKNNVASNWENGWASGQVSSNGVNITQDVSHEIQGAYQLISDYTATLGVNDSSVTTIDSVTGGAVARPIYTWTIQSLLPNTSFTTQITGLNNLTGSSQNSYQWSEPGVPSLPSDYAWTTGPTFTFSPAGPQQISGANGVVTLTIAGQITYTAPLTGLAVTLKYQTTAGVNKPTGSIITPDPNYPGNYVNIFPSDGTVLNTQQNTAYRIPAAPTTIGAVAATGYAFSVLFNASPTFTSGTTPSSGTSLEVNSALTGTIILLQATSKVIQTVYSGLPAATYNTVFSGGGGSPATSDTIQTTGSVTTSGNNFAVGDGSCVFTVSKSSNSSVLVGDLNITWPDGSTTGPIAAGTTLSAQSKTISIANFATYPSLNPVVTIDEATPTTYRTTLAIVTNIAGTEFTQGSIWTGSFNDSFAGATASFNITAPANTCYPTQGCNFHWIANNNNPTLALSAGGAGITNPVSYTQPASDQTLTVYVSGTINPDPVMSLNIVNNIVGAPASQGSTPQPLPDTAGLYTISPGPVATVNTNPNPALSSWQAPKGDPWTITPSQSIIATTATNFAFTTASPFAFTQSGTYALWGSPMPSFGTLHIAEYTLTGQVVRQYADIKLEQNSLVSTSRFQATFAATGGATRSLVPNNSSCPSLSCTLNASSYDAGLMTGNAGQVTITVLKITNSGITQSSGSVLYADGTSKNFNNNVNTATDPAFSHTIANLGAIADGSAVYSVSVDES